MIKKVEEFFEVMKMSDGQIFRGSDTVLKEEFREKRFFPCGTEAENSIVGVAELETNVFVLVKEDGTGYGSDGNLYQLHQLYSPADEILDEKWALVSQ